VGRVKKIEAIITPFKLDDVKDALIEIGIQGITFSDVMAFGRQKGHTDYSKVKVEIIVADPLVPRVLDAIQRSAQFVGRICYSKIFITEVMEAVF
jgi:nitrogen regulatory protein PII